ncbi:sugar ABC transporter ATP-binding protein [Kaistia nematophila]|uniref:Sugar ABC transporter ATP-binding protein n=1 Tax=Kaistia nematophila TaxID=2994654 RepID=A0A9X3E1M1_9HYPH|nr:sugar ABC transporter ATP-binding protein [Kaistia nematophila]MCX5569910.1 sugar ABC transporter ATP-binding protein [Kaistia nematophila]
MPVEDQIAMENPIALEVVSVDKRFGSVQALADVSMQFRAGRVTALLGENGAGKSTLIRVCSGVHQPDAGEVRVSGKAERLQNSLAAKAKGIAVVHQEPQLVTQMTVAENIFLARLGSRGGTSLHRRAGLVAEAERLLAGLGLDKELPDLGARCVGLSAAERQLVEIARALADDPHVLFLDEPNSSLTRKETDRLFDIVRRLRDRGTAVILVSHRLGEVYEISDEVIVMRDGRKVGEGPVDELPKQKAIQLMAGERLKAALDLAESAPPPPAAGAEPVLSVRNASGLAFSDVSFDIRAGEIVGMAGLVGSGRTEIIRAILGADPLFSGDIRLKGRPVRFGSPRAALKGGIAFISEERRTSVFYGHDIAFNLTSNVLDRFGRFGFFSPRRRRAFAQKSADEIGVKADNVDVPIRTLSGGNQQKVLLARALASNPSLVILDEPTRGVDVRTKADMYRLIRTLAHERGLAVWFVSSELDEVLQLADRIVVVRGGQIADSLARGPEAARVVASALGEKIEDAATTALASDMT